MSGLFLIRNSFLASVVTRVCSSRCDSLLDFRPKSKNQKHEHQRTLRFCVASGWWMADVWRQKAVRPEPSLAKLVLAHVLLLSVAPTARAFDLRWESCQEMLDPTRRPIPEEVQTAAPQYLALTHNVTFESCEFPFEKQFCFQCISGLGDFNPRVQHPKKILPIKKKIVQGTEKKGISF